MYYIYIVVVVVVVVVEVVVVVVAAAAAVVVVIRCLKCNSILSLSHVTFFFLREMSGMPKIYHTFCKSCLKFPHLRQYHVLPVDTLFSPPIRRQVLKCSALHPSEHWLAESTAVPLVAKFNKRWDYCQWESGSGNFTRSSSECNTIPTRPLVVYSVLGLIMR